MYTILGGLLAFIAICIPSYIVKRIYEINWADSIFTVVAFTYFAFVFLFVSYSTGHFIKQLVQ